MSSLQYIRKYDGASTDYNENRGSLRYVARNKVFNDDQDEQMSKYVICCAKIYFGLFPKEIQKWVSELATQQNVKRTATRLDNEKASKNDFIHSCKEIFHCLFVQLEQLAFREQQAPTK